MNTYTRDSRLVPVAVLCLVIAAILIVPFKVISYGFLPEDDALRHVAKVVSGKDWKDILVLRNDRIMDNHPGWHAILNAVYKIGRFDADSLVVFSVLFLFLLFALIPIFFLERPEVWPIVLIIFAMSDLSFIFRLFFGRPYIVTMALLLAFCYLWPKLSQRKVHYGALILITLGVSLSTWIHGSWYLFALPIISFFLAREWRAGVIFTICTFFGIMLGAAFTGQPFEFLKNNLTHLILALGQDTPKRLLVIEFQPFTGDQLTVIAVIFMLGWRKIRGQWNRKVVDNPVFIMVSLSWAAGFLVRRFWIDWGMVALSAWLAGEIQDTLRGMMEGFSSRRIALTAAIVMVFYLAVTNDTNARWSENLTKEYLSTDEAGQYGWLPEPGGILYSDDMTIFYDTFFKNPKAPWRYILGFEPTLMPEEDLKILRKIQWNYGAFQSYDPWAAKMRPEDRLVLRRTWNNSPLVGGLEWNYAATGIWVGRLPRK